ncbi:hypothetical protein BGZ73_002915 [Actinomortierella ambigua]|nr:hypothetical protein BGZ73_002915 [Actinomortierella ambigua]
MSTFHQQMHRTPFDISELHSLICSFLSGKDLKACALVNKAWHQKIQQHVWRTISTPTNSTKYYASIDEFHNSVRNNTCWARHIRGLPNLDRLSPLLDILLESCHDLISIDVWIQDRYHMARWFPLIKQNAGLKTLKILYKYAIEDEPLLLEALVGVPQLRCLELSGVTSLSYLYRILEMCPLIDHLTVAKVIDEEEQDSRRQNEIGSTATTSTLALRHFAVPLCYGNPAVAQLLSRTPFLESLVLGTDFLGADDGASMYTHDLIPLFKAGHLPRLTNLTLPYSTEQAELLEAIPAQQLRSVEIESPNEQTLSVLFERQSQSLENIRFVGFLDLSWIPQMFFRCPRLKKLYVKEFIPSDHLEIRFLVDQPWVCMDLEECCIPLGVSRYPNIWTESSPVLTKAMKDNEKESQPKEEWQVMEGLFIEKLRQLKKLREAKFENTVIHNALSAATQQEILELVARNGA